MSTVTMTRVDLPELALLRPLPGLEPLTRFALVQLDDDGLLFALRSTEDPDVRLFVVPPDPFFPDYAPVLPEEDRVALGIESAEDAMVLLVLSPGATLEDSTANLLAPLVVNSVTRSASQVVLTGSDLPLRAPLLG